MSQSATGQPNAFGAELRRARNAVGLTQDALARKASRQSAGTSTSGKSISAYERAERVPGYEVSRCLYSVLELDDHEMQDLERLRRDARDTQPELSQPLDTSVHEDVQVVLPPSARWAYSQHVDAAVQSSERFWIVGRSTLGWIGKHVEALEHRFRAGLRSVFILVGSGYTSSDDGQDLASELIDRSEGREPYGARSPHEKNIRTAAQKLREIGASSENAEIIYQFLLPSYTAVAFDNSVVIEPGILSPVRLPFDQIPFMIVQRHEQSFLFNHYVDDIRYLIQAASDSNASWPEELPRPRYADMGYAEAAGP